MIRFSAMGDVAMTAPLIKQIAAQYPETDFLYLSRPLFEPFFQGIPNLKFYAFNPKKYNGLHGIYRLYKELIALNISAIADLHFNLRSRILCFYFKVSGIKVAHLDKGRSEKRLLTRKKNKHLVPIKPMWIRYSDVFKNLGLKVDIINSLDKQEPENLSKEVLAISGGKESDKWIGISPFAQHQQKIYPLKKMEQIIASLGLQDIKLFVFGGGKEEEEIAQQWEITYPYVKSVIGKLRIEKELELISNLEVMISMDSSGMHLASLMGIKVVSVWGATHPYAGFLGFGQDEANCVQADLYCRPCSIYGNKPCFRGDLACLHMIEPKEIVIKTLNIVYNG